jgi:subfamily B ATP-binding cassette protein MsbA
MDLRFIFNLATPWRYTLAAGALLMVMESAVALAVPWFGGLFAEQMLKGGHIPSNTGALLYSLLALFALQALLRFGNSYVLGRSARSILAQLRIRLYDHLQALPLTYYQQRRRGEILSLLVNDVAQLSGFISGTMLSVAPLMMTVAGAIALMISIDVQLAGIVIVMVPMFYILLRILGRRLRPLASQIQDAYAGTVATAEENLAMLPAIKIFTREHQESARYKSQIQYLLRLTTQELRIYAAMGPTVQFLAASGMVVLLWLMSGQIEQRSPAEMVSFLLYAALLTRPVSALSELYGETRRVKGTLQRLKEVLSEEREPLGGGAVLPPVRGAIEFQNVSFAYPGRSPILVGLNIRIDSGETVALTGSNGSGKSTIAHLLMRLIESSEGRILIDGTDVAGVTLHSLRSQIGLVPQHVLLFNGSVHDNIALGKPDADRQSVMHAARLAQAHDFIAQLPQGYESGVGDQGIRLSGGQRQRIALARALLKDPPILIFDEATAMFDPDGERAFISDYRHQLGRRTVILITHRPASLALADRVIKLEEERSVVSRLVMQVQST